MKATLIPALLLLLSGGASQAQEATRALTDLFSPRRIIKTNLAGYALLAVNANYEQKVSGKTSAGLLGGYKLPTTIRLEGIGELNGDRQTYTGDIRPSGLFLNPYFRFYPGTALKGFYLEAFGRYYNYSFEVPYDYEKNERTIRAALDGTANGMGGGLALGVQVALASRLYLDLHAGYGMGVGQVHVETNDPNLELEDYLSIKRNIEQHRDDADVRFFLLGNVLTGIEADANERSAWADIRNRTFPILRAGISLGVAF